MRLLCFDISSGGITASVLDSRLANLESTEEQWKLDIDERGAAALSAKNIEQHFKSAIRRLESVDGIDAICIGTFMHNFMLVDEADEPLTPVFTWLDSRGDEGVEFIRSRLGDRFHQITGCRYHPMFPIFKLAAVRMNDAQLWRRPRRIVSIKALLIHRLTGAWVEDLGSASATGLFNVLSADWENELLQLLESDKSQLPTLAARTDIAGRVRAEAASQYGLPAGVPVIVGSGDGFLANLGSECETPSRIAVTLGTSAVARQTLSRPVLSDDAGTFCYRADQVQFLLGCAGSNGGNVLDWGRRILGPDLGEASADPPIFIPVLHGERSPDWNARLTGSWHSLTARHTSADLLRSIVEGVVFNLAHFVEILRQTSGEAASDLVLSGNGFLQPDAAPILATVTSITTWIPQIPGAASLRGAGICALRALGAPVPPLELIGVSPLGDTKIMNRYHEYRRLRAAVAEQLN